MFNENQEDQNDVNDCIEAVKNLPGMGQATLSKLKSGGFSSLESIAFTPPNVLQDECGFGVKTTAKLINLAMERLGITFETAEVVWKRREHLHQLTTGSINLDKLLGGGIEPGTLTEIFGESTTGKTQICHQLCVNAQLPYKEGGLEGRALYFDTQGSFRPERIIQMAKFLDLDYEEILKNIIHVQVNSSYHQIMMLRESEPLIGNKNIKILIIDNIINHFKAEYSEKGTYTHRKGLIRRYLNDLQRYTNIYPNLAIVFVNQVRDKPDVFYGNPFTHLGGHEIAHGSTTRLFLRRGKVEERIAKLVKSPYLPENDNVFNISKKGIC